jgi:hypothetical protein
MPEWRVSRQRHLPSSGFQPRDHHVTIAQSHPAETHPFFRP